MTSDPTDSHDLWLHRPPGLNERTCTGDPWKGNSPLLVLWAPGLFSHVFREKILKAFSCTQKLDQISGKMGAKIYIQNSRQTPLFTPGVNTCFGRSDHSRTTGVKTPNTYFFNKYVEIETISMINLSTEDVAHICSYINDVMWPSAVWLKNQVFFSALNKCIE